MKKQLGLFFIFSIIVVTTNAQFLMDMVDTTKDMGKGMLGVYKKFDHVKIGGYVQPQYQVSESQGIKSYEGGDFGALVSDRFMLRRSRIRIDYIHLGDSTQPGLQFVFQTDANERGFTVRDIWGRIFENKYRLFSFTTGMFARPFGFEVNYSSSDRESPERGRMSQILMKGERDLGAMVSFEPRRNIGRLTNLKIDAGIFNGQGINATGDFDNTKDFIGRVAYKPFMIYKKVSLAFGASILQGGLMQNTKFQYQTQEVSGIKKYVVDSSASNLYATAPRKYYGADVQLRIKNRVGFSEFRAEVLQGKQTGTAGSSETPTALVSGTDGFYVRNFAGAYFAYVQSLGSLKHQMVLKYDYYDPNTNVVGSQIGQSGSNLGVADIKYNTIGLGYVYYMTENIKWQFYYAKVTNETTQLKGYTTDVKDNVFTCRLQFRF